MLLTLKNIEPLPTYGITCHLFFHPSFSIARFSQICLRLQCNRVLAQKFMHVKNYCPFFCYTFSSFFSQSSLYAWLEYAPLNKSHLSSLVTSLFTFATPCSSLRYPQKIYYSPYFLRSEVVLQTPGLISKATAIQSHPLYFPAISTSK